MDDYLRDFVQEADEQITELNNALLDLENDPTDEEAMDRIFRTAHTIKGNSSAMGFTKAADLAHAIEDLLDEMRAGRVAVTPDTMDDVFDGIDRLEQMIEEVRDQEEPQTNPREVIEMLRGAIEAAPGPDVRIEDPTDEEIEKTLEHVDGPDELEQLVYHVRLAVDEDELEEGMLVLEALADAFDVLTTDPPQNVIRNEDYGDSFDAVISSAIGRDDITKALEAVEQVDEVIVTDVSDYVEEIDEDVEPVDVDDMEVEELLDSVSEYDDIDAMAKQLGEEEAIEELGDAGSFDELALEEEVEDIEIAALVEDEELAADADIEESDLGDMSDLEPEVESKDSNTIFKELQEEVDEVEFDELETELDSLEFDEFADEEEVGFDELLAEGETAQETEPDDLSEFDSEFDASEGGEEFDELFEEEGGAVDDEELDEVLAEAEETTVGDEEEEVSFEELVEEAESADQPSPTAEPNQPSVEPQELEMDFDDVAEGDVDEPEFDEAVGDTAASSGPGESDVSASAGSETVEDSGGPTDVGASQADESSVVGDVEPTPGAESTTASTDDHAVGSEAQAVEAVEETGRPTGRSLGDIESIRVNVSRVDSLLNQVEELVTGRIRLRRALEEGDVDQALDDLDALETLTMRMQDTVMDIRLVPLEQVVGNLPRVVRDIARDQGKEVDFAIEGGDVELDRRILSELGDPLMHLVRNAVDHGIEKPDEREAAGKDREGKLRIRARRTRDRVTIEVSDDGRGLDREAIAETALQEGLVTEDELTEMDDSSVYQLAFEAGFSTAEEVTGVSGRGVGMDVVRETVRNLDGAVGIESSPEQGTTISLRVPVSVAIVRVLFVKVGDEEYGIPVKNVDEISRTSVIETVDGEEVLTHDERVYPLIRLNETLEAPGTTSNGDGMLIRMNDDIRQVALHCDRVMRQEEVVVKPYEGLLSGIPGLSGAAVLGEGNVVNILDVESL